MLKKRFEILCQNYTEDNKLIDTLWQEIKTQYSNSNRYYHTLKHLEHIYRELEEVELNHILEFSIFYHDIIYDIKKRDNEEQSAKLAVKNLNKLDVQKNIQIEVKQLILETKTHQTNSKQNRLFLDADLAILGAEPIEYKDYILNIRKEYTFYNNKTYNSGRIKLLKIFLKKDRIYQSEHFYTLYEKKAQYNLSEELKWRSFHPA